MKTACFFAALSVAGAVAPPKISLSLEGMTSAYQLKESIVRDHDQNLVQNTGVAVKSRQDWTEKCAAVKTLDAEGKSTLTTAVNCPFPVAQGYDHHDQGVDVVTRVYRVDLDGTPQEFSVADQIELNAGGTNFQNVDMWNHRSTFLFKYDATDKAGNHAEQVVFALILDDTSKPIFDQKVSGAACKNDDESTRTRGGWEPSITVQAVSDWALCKFSVTDNVDASTAEGLAKETDATQTTDIKYQVTYLGRDHPVFNGVDPAHPKSTWWHDQQYLAVNWAGFSGSTSDLSFNSAAKLFNPTGYGAMHVGKFLVTASIEDFAGVYGHNNVNNVNEVTTAILVQDTNAPAIYLEGSSPDVTECDKNTITDQTTCGKGDTDPKCYIEAGATGKDKLDTEALKNFLTVTVSLEDKKYEIAKDTTDFFFPTISNTLNKLEFSAGKPVCSTKRELKYNAFDFAMNAAPEVTRHVTTVDTVAPVVNLVGENTKILKYCQKNCGNGSEDLATCESATHHIDRKLDGVDPGATCSDQCDASVSDDDVTMSWGPRTFNARVLGDYVRTYSCSDGCANEKKITRTIVVEDCGLPELSFQGKESETLEANRDIEYTDAGALCSDWVDGELSHAVEVSGDVVNMRIPGTYNIQYNCQDLTGNEAYPLKRTVVVQDTTRPTMSLNGAVVNYLEAGFPYIDAGAVATDTLDGDITQYIWTDGDTVTDQRAFYAYHSCASMQKASKTLLKNGAYYITAKTNGKFIRQLVNCYFSGASMTLKPFAFKIVTNTAGATAGCAAIGMAPMSSAQEASYVEQVTPVAEYAKVGNMETFICTETEAAATASSVHGSGLLQDQIADAEQGRYVISFHVEDKAGNKQCDETKGLTCLKRTVVVKDTLPPVVSLSVKTRMAAQTLAEESRDASKIHGHNNYMAESNASSNGFIIGAIASAVAGVALLGMSMKKGQATSVPV